MTTRNFSKRTMVSITDNQTGDSSYELITYMKNMSGRNSPKPRTRPLPNNPYSMDGFSLLVASARRTIVQKGSGLPVDPVRITTYGVYQQAALLDSSYDLRATSTASATLLNKLKSSDINLAQSFGERMQTVGMLMNTASRLTRSYSHLRSGRLGSALSALGSSTFELDKRHPGASRRFRTNYPKNGKQAASSAWLEMQYGWRPLLNDVYGGAKTLAEFHVSRDSDSYFARRDVRAFANIHEYVDHFGKVRSSCETKVNLKITYLVSNPLLAYSAMLGLTNPALLAWELTPFSFVVDWFLPIGNYLSTIDAAYGKTFLDGCKTIKRTGVTEGHNNLSFEDAYEKYERIENYLPSESFSLTRSVLSDFPSTSLPRFRSPIKLTNAISAIALLVQVFKR